MTDFAQLLVAGIALGGLYALVAIGFVVIYRATGVLNFAQGSLLALGAYLTYAFHEQAGLPFGAAVAAGTAGTALAGYLVQRVVMSRLVGRPVFAAVMVTIGVSIAIDQLITWRWGFGRLNLGDPWGDGTVNAAGVVVAFGDLIRIGAAAAAVTLLFLFLRTRTGLALRATADDPEAAAAQGIDPSRVVGLAWALSAGIAGLAGVLLSSGSRGIEPSLSIVALAAFPAIIVGGLDSVVGAVYGGLLIGVVQVMTAGYSGLFEGWAGTNLHTVMPYLAMVAVLLVRPNGLLGQQHAERA